MTGRQMGAAEWAMMLALSLLWGATFFFVEIALRDLGPLTLVLGRVAMGAATLWLLVLASGAVLPKTLRDWRELAVMGLMNNAIPFTLIFWGQTQITSSLASILNATTPIFGVIVAHLFLADERATPNKALGVLFGIGGVILLIGPDALAGVDGSLLGQLALIGAAISYAFAGAWGRRLGRFAPPVAAAGMLTMSTLMMVPVALLAEGLPGTAPGLYPVLAWVALGVAGTGLAYILYFRILERAGATNLLLVTFMIPPSAILLGVWFLDESLSLTAVGGLVLIFIGLACVDGRFLRRRATA
ncbi:MAG: DMT family transporter [Minwuia sp.]|uniref:DMT family transporter n=1 Tax=Minwuia sp. TaxID=2493630 RepID=UPI003A8B6475